MLAVELEALRILDGCDAAIACFEDIGDQNFGDDAGAELSILWAEYAQSLFELGRRNEAEEAAIESARLNAQNEEALWFLREIRRKPTDAKTHHYRIMAEGDWSVSSGGSNETPTSFFANYSVCADNEEEALGLVAELQPDEVDNLRIEETKVLGRFAKPKGVYSSSGYMLYEKKNNGD